MWVLRMCAQVLIIVHQALGPSNHLSSCICLFILGQSPSLSLELMVWLGQLASGLQRFACLCSPPQMLGLQTCTTVHGFYMCARITDTAFTWVLGIQTLAPCSHCGIVPTEHLLTSQSIFLQYHNFILLFLLVSWLVLLL